LLIEEIQYILRICFLMRACRGLGVSKMHVTADRDRCIGAGLCVLTAPKIFEHDDEEGLVTVIDGDPGAEYHDAIRLARELCPSHAIQLSLVS